MFRGRFSLRNHHNGKGIGKPSAPIRLNALTVVLESYHLPGDARPGAWSKKSWREAAPGWAQKK